MENFCPKLEMKTVEECSNVDCCHSITFIIKFKHIQPTKQAEVYAEPWQKAVFLMF